MKMYQVGGCVRDEILGVKSNDIDFTVVLDDEFFEDGLDKRGNTPFEVMTLNLKRQGFEIFLETPEFLTVRARFPKGDERVGMFANGKALTADFVLARKEGSYSDGRRPDAVEVGTLEDDLARRDFTVNAVAKDTDGSYIDPFNGVADIKAGIIKAVGDPFERLAEDALRAVRALRFAVTKGFWIKGDLSFAMQSNEVLYQMASRISDERIQQELSKMFRYDTYKSLNLLSEYPALTRAMFSGNVSLDATLKTKGRGK